MIEAAVSLRGLRVAVVSQDPLERLAPEVASRLLAHWRVDDVTNVAQLEDAVRALGLRYGPIDYCFGAFEQLQVPLAIVRETFGIPGLPVAAASNFRDKARMKDVLRAAGVPVARHRLLAARVDAETFVREVGFPIVVKPPAGAGARATHRIEDAETLAQFLERFPPDPRDPMLAEEFLRGTEHSLETVSVGGKALWHSLTHYDPTPLHVLENPWIQWCVLLPREVDDPQYDDIKAVGDRALTALGMQTGVSHCEWFRRADGTVAISEIAARPPGAQITTMISRAHDIDFVKAWVSIMVGGDFSPPPRKYAVGTVYLRGQGGGRVSEVLGLDVVQRECGAMICDVRLPSRGQSPSGSYEGEGFIMLRDPDTERVRRALQRVLATVRVKLS